MLIFQNLKQGLKNWDILGTSLLSWFKDDSTGSTISNVSLKYCLLLNDEERGPPALNAVLRGLNVHNSSTRELTNSSSMVWLLLFKCETIIFFMAVLGAELDMK